MQVFRYVMMFRHRGDQQFKLPNGYCDSSARACRALKAAVRAAKMGDFELMLDWLHVSEAYLRALYDLTDWFPNPGSEILHFTDLVFMLYARSHKKPEVGASDD